MPFRMSSFPVFFAAVTLACGTGVTVKADGPERVTGYFCGAKSEQIAYLKRRAAGDSGEIAVNVVNKAAGKQTCAFFLPATAIPHDEQTVMSDGIVYRMQSFVFLPEKVERWTGTYFGSLQTTRKFSEL